VTIIPWFADRSSAGQDGQRSQNTKDCISIRFGDAGAFSLTNITELVNLLAKWIYTNTFRKFPYGAKLQRLQTNVYNNPSPITACCTHQRFEAKDSLDVCMPRACWLIFTLSSWGWTSLGYESANLATRLFTWQQEQLKFRRS